MAYNYGLLWIYYGLLWIYSGLLWGIVAYYFGLLGFPGSLWGSKWLFLQIGGLFLGVLMTRALPFWVYIRAPDFWRLSNSPK